MVSLTNDKMFKSVFTRNKDILKEFLILQFDLDMPIDDTLITINNVELPDDIIKEYKKTIDILVYLDDEVIANIEANRSLYKNVKQRNCVYFGKLYGLSLKEGEKPSSLNKKKIYQLNINAHKDDNKFGEDVYYLMSKKTNKKLLDNYAIYVKNLEYYHDLYYTKHRKLTKREMWLVALTSSSFSELYETLSKLLKEDKVNKFMESVIIMSQDDMILKDWERKQLDELVEYTTLENAKKNSLKQGISKGISQNKIEIAKKLISKGMNIKDISEVTGLSEKEITILSDKK